MSDIQNAAAAVATITGGADKPGTASVVQTSNRRIELLLAACAVALVCITLIIVGVLTWVKWPEATAEQRIKFLGWDAWIALTGILIIVIAICSPWIGRIEAKAGDAELSIDGGSGGTKPAP